MPGNDRLRFNQDQSLSPFRPQMTERNPEQSIKAIQLRTGLLALPNGELLSKRNSLQRQDLA